MSEAQHTPGPWVSKYYDRITLPQDVDGSMSIAHVYGRKGAPNEQAANRLLIAAAPDLLAAVRSAIEQFDVFINARKIPANTVAYSKLLAAHDRALLPKDGT